MPCTYSSLVEVMGTLFFVPFTIMELFLTFKILPNGPNLIFGLYLFIAYA